MEYIVPVQNDKEFIIGIIDEYRGYHAYKRYNDCNAYDEYNE